MKNIFTIIVLHLLTGQLVLGQLNPEQYSQIDSIAERLHKEGKLSGGLLVAEGNQIIYEGAFGLADRELKIPNTPDMLFWDASIGKMFTAVLVLQLYEEGKIDLQDPILKHLKWFKHEMADKITLHDLLSHRAGFSNAGVYDVRKNAEPYQISQRTILENNIINEELVFEPGTKYLYSNTGYVLLAEVVMAHLGPDYNAILQEKIFEPLEMNRTYWSSPLYGPGMPVYYLNDGSPLIPADMLDFTGPGGEKTTLRDLHKFMLAVGTDKLISQSTWELALQPHSLPNEAIMQWGPHRSPYGYGFSLIDLPYTQNETIKTVSHGGTSEGFSGYALKFLKKDRVVILWNNEYKNPMIIELFQALSEISSD